MSDPIFPDQNAPEEKATDYIANPVRVQLPKYDDRREGRRWTQMDLVALANNILARETECAELRKTVRELSIRMSGLVTQVEALKAVVETARPFPTSGKLGRILAAIQEIADESEDEDSDDDSIYDRY